jgi:hypothetical protein
MTVMSPRRQIGVYLAITFTVSWTLGIGYPAFGGQWGSPASQAVAILFMMPPAFATLVIKGAILKEPVLETLGLSLSLNRFWLVAWSIPPLVFATSVALGGALPGQELALTVDDFIAHFLPHIPTEEQEGFITEVREYGMHPAIGMVLQAMVAGMTLNAVRGLGEELGWRGLMYREVPGSFYQRALIIGGIWGVWYAPLVAQGFRYEGAPVAGIPMCIAWCLLAGAVAMEIRHRSGSILPAAILYGTFEGLAKLPPLTRGGDAITMGMYGVPGCIALALVLVALRWRDISRVIDARARR